MADTSKWTPPPEKAPLAEHKDLFEAIEKVINKPISGPKGEEVVAEIIRPSGRNRPEKPEEVPPPQ